MFLSIGICIVALCSVKFISNNLEKAPEGWEDENGFHSLPSAQISVGSKRLRTAAVIRKQRKVSLKPLVVAKRLIPHRG